MIGHLKDFLRYLSLNRNLSPHTVRAYDSDLTQFIDHVAVRAGRKRVDLAPDSLDRAAIRDYLAELHAQGQSRATAARKLAAIRTFLRYLRREGIVDADPGGLVPTPKREVRMPVHLSEDEMVKMLDAPDDEQPLGRRDHAILELFYASGLRLAELAGLDLAETRQALLDVRAVGRLADLAVVDHVDAGFDLLRHDLRNRERNLALEVGSVVGFTAGQGLEHRREIGRAHV